MTAPHLTTRATLPAILLALATVVSAVSSLMSALPSIAVATRASQTQLTWIVDAYALTFAALLLPAGAVGDRFGRRRTLLTGLGIFAVASAVPLVSGDPTTLIAVRAVMGLAAALVMPATLSTITSAFPADRRELAVATWAGVAAAGAIFGLFGTGLVLVWWSWEAVFVLSGVLALVALLAVARSVPESASPKEASRDPLGVLLSMLALGTLVYAVIEAPTRGLLSAGTLGLVATAVVIGAAYAVWESHTARPLLPVRHFRNAAFSAGALSLGAIFFGFFGFILLFLQYLQLLRGYSALESACALIPLPLGLMPAARGLAPRLTPRLGQARQSAIGLAVMALALWWLSRADAGTAYWVLAIGLWPLGIGAGLAMPPATSAITAALPSGEQGVASAMNDLSRELGGALGIAVLSTVLTSTYRDHLDLSAVPGRFRAVIADSAPAGTHAPIPQVRAMAARAYTDGVQSGLLCAAMVLGAVAVLLMLLVLLPPRARRSRATRRTPRQSPWTAAGRTSDAG